MTTAGISHRIGLTSNGTCSLCRIANMDGDNLWACTEFIDVSDNITARYWESRRCMAEQPQTGVGYKKKLVEIQNSPPLNDINDKRHKNKVLRGNVWKSICIRR
ncbi:hypothetical protein CDAR_614621 [Caerostris darwini]|uniref:Uncharacterized protein n=1 Tax=Caerostris darwini TaxID=1538125 RepID=A0AAV4UMC5_9ARAC|nr:hypothetical protein CDAR_614621 [Caerostris darwini]